MPPSDPRVADRQAREVASEVAAELQQAGFTALFAGGCVRDELLGLEPKDYDIATNARPEDVRACFPRAQAVGAAFGVMLVRRGGVSVEVATFRTDGDYADHRRPASVEFCDPVQDAQRRDFTINGLFRDPLTGTIHDHVGGLADLEAGILRAIGDPAARFGEDHLRMLRAVRFHAALGMQIEAATESAIRTHAAALTGVSRERLGDECRRILHCPGRVAGVDQLERLGLGAAILGGPREGAGWDHLESIGHAGAEMPALFAAWACDRVGDGFAPDAVAALFRSALLLSNQERDGMLACLRVRDRFRGWDDLGMAGRKRLASAPWAAAGLGLHGVRRTDHADEVRADIEVLSQTGLSPQRLVDGDTLLASGMQAGPEFGRVLEAVYDAQLEGRVTSVEEGLALAKSLARA